MADERGLLYRSKDNILAYLLKNDAYYDKKRIK